jgi:hypothetical protein
VPEEPTDSDFETVAEFREIFEAELAAGRLRQAGIETHVLDQSFRQEPLPNVRSFAIVRLLVPRAAAAEARRLLAEAAPTLEDEQHGGGEPEPEP